MSVIHTEKSINQTPLSLAIKSSNFEAASILLMNNAFYVDLGEPLEHVAAEVNLLDLFGRNDWYDSEIWRQSEYNN